MSTHKATIRWNRATPDFLKGKYSREHTWTFDGGITVAASPAPSSVPPPYCNPANVDPEEAFVASVSSCHMLTFLYVAAKAGFEIKSYEDEAVGVMTKNEKGVPWVSTITLRPRIIWGDARRPTSAEEDHLHHLAHEQCYVANSIKTAVNVESPQ
ncbi:MAG TPA: OsmC family protein [Gammaproteobacteria bacterium]|jgi:organic hydroperoxide reductase OsmC/OhrA